MNSPAETMEAMALGRQVVADGRLGELRQRIRISRSAMAELLYANTSTYIGWEDRPTTRLWPETARRIGVFYAEASRVLEEIGGTTEGLIAFPELSMRLGMPHELILRRVRRGEFDTIDLGILGLWVTRQTLDLLSRHEVRGMPAAA